MVSRYEADVDDIARVLDDEPPYRVRQVWDGLYRRIVEPDEMTELPRALRSRVGEAFPAALAPVAESVSDAGATVKWAWALDDGACIETVLMHYETRSG
ncbi:MAG: 23S rRNA (adenine(2503)-C(2))-methyltransferase RlmN, partial [Acidimicrobiales bacterium]